MASAVAPVCSIVATDAARAARTASFALAPASEGAPFSSGAAPSRAPALAARRSCPCPACLCGFSCPSSPAGWSWAGACSPESPPSSISTRSSEFLRSFCGWSPATCPWWNAGSAREPVPRASWPLRGAPSFDHVEPNVNGNANCSSALILNRRDSLRSPSSTKLPAGPLYCFCSALAAVASSGTAATAPAKRREDSKTNARSREPLAELSA